MKIIFVLIGMFVANSSFAQQQASTINEPVNSTIDIIQSAKKGTFQVVFSSENDPLVSLDSDLLSAIEKNRKEDETSYLKLSETTVVKIFSKNEINSSSFVLKNATLISPEFIQQYNQQ